MSTHSVSKTINISVAHELLERLDQVAKAEYSSRSEFIRAAVVERLTALERASQSGWTPTDTPVAANNVNLLMTDQQLDDTVKALKQEQNRRYWKKDLTERAARHVE
jgi:Arc/MetJ-type ribon-helix-helix transcriptional regulator